MQKTRRVFLFTSAIAAVFLGACAKREKFVQVALKVSNLGNYEVDGRKMSRGELEAALTELKPNEGTFSIHFQPDRTAPYESVRYAMAIAQKLGAKVGIVGSEQF